MAGKATALNTNQLFMYLNRGDIADFKFSPLFTTLFFPNVATFSTQNIMLDTLDIEEVTMSAFVRLWWVARFSAIKGTKPARLNLAT